MSIELHPWFDRNDDDGGEEAAAPTMPPPPPLDEAAAGAGAGREGDLLGLLRQQWDTHPIRPSGVYSEKILSFYSVRHPVSREVLKLMFWKVPMAVWPHLWLATAQEDSWNFSEQS